MPLMETLQNTNNLVLFHLGSFVKTLNKNANHLLRKDGFALKLEQLPVIMAVFYQGIMCQQELADALDRDKSSVQRTIVFLLKHDLVKISGDKQDKRRNLVTLTETGSLLAQKLHNRLIRLEQVLFSHLREEDKNTLVGLIRKVERSMLTAVPEHYHNQFTLIQ
jgi:DNA-binding MarR family transcriptional regulator